MPASAYELHRPRRQETSVIFASPHSGRDYCRTFLERTVLDDRSVRSSEDAFVDLLFADAPLLGAPLLVAKVPRAFIDLNRSAEELDPALIEGVRLNAQNPRVTSGLGVVPRVVAGGRAIYRGKITRAEAEDRIERFWKPYHAALEMLMRQTRARFGEAVLIDCHSMPHEAVENISPRNRPCPEIVLGDRFGAAAASDVVDRIEAAFSSAGLRVARNSPFAGAYTTQHYGRPSAGQHVVQVEIDRALYMNERQIRPNANFQAFRRLMRSIVEDIAALGRRDDAAPLAAE